jgi:hypothetical protein
MNKRKIINDPVYGFISLPTDLIYDLLEHPWLQRLGRIRQLGLTYLVYPGAQHSRLSHALGAMHLMQLALETLSSKGIVITPAEAEASAIAVLLHDVGHGPFSHTLEHSIVTGAGHEAITAAMMQKLNQEFNGHLDLAIEIFSGNHKKKFLHQLVSSQLDMDRMDYLNRDSFFTGVAEGVIGYDRIIKMLFVHNNELVVEEKGMYSVEKFLISRRFMYWQVYMHKTVLAAEEMLKLILTRARSLQKKHQSISPALNHFLSHQTSMDDLKKETILHQFAKLDDGDVLQALKIWSDEQDSVMAFLSRRLLMRKLFKIEISERPFPESKISDLVNRLSEYFRISPQEAANLVIHDSTSNHAYNPSHENIHILYRSGEVQDVSAASELFTHDALKKPTVRHYLCYPKEVSSR